MLGFTFCVQIPLPNLFSGVFVVTYRFSFCLSWKTFIAPSILNDGFAGYCVLGLKLFSFSARKISPQGLLAFNVSVEKSAVILMGLPLYVICFFLSYSLQYSFSSLCTCCFNGNMPWSSCILVWSVWCSGGLLYLYGHRFL
jgi:ABC-type glycerol-3-phosphate transport system permease component